jgi:hypothetical protein
MPFNAERSAYGLQQEDNLIERLSLIVGEELIKFPSRYSTFDFESENFLVELKSRRKTVSPSCFSTWLLPACKGEVARNSEKSVLFFYHWEVDDSLYYLEYNEELFDSFTKETPHFTNQLHYYISSSLWTLIDSDP